MTKPLPVTVIGGYLGCGKTTLVNHLLRNSEGMRLAVLVNDFGALPIDADLIESQQGDVISLAGGCICCSYGNDLGDALVSLQVGETPIDQVIVESSGVALPGAIGSSLSLLRDFTLHCIAVLVDVETIRQHEADRYLSDTINRQLADADLILLNKVDLVDEEHCLAAQQWIATKNAAARQLETVQAQVTPAIILDSDGSHCSGFSASGYAVEKESQDQLVTGPSVHGPAVFDAIEFTMAQRFHVEKLATVLADANSGLVRAKGFVPGENGQLETLQIVGSRWAVSQAPPDATAGLVCIGRIGEISAETIRDCISSSVLER